LLVKERKADWLLRRNWMVPVHQRTSNGKPVPMDDTNSRATEFYGAIVMRATRAQVRKYWQERKKAAPPRRKSESEEKRLEKHKQTQLVILEHCRSLLATGVKEGWLERRASSLATETELETLASTLEAAELDTSDTIRFIGNEEQWAFFHKEADKLAVEWWNNILNFSGMTCSHQFEMGPYLLQTNLPVEAMLDMQMVIERMLGPAGHDEWNKPSDRRRGNQTGFGPDQSD